MYQLVLYESKLTKFTEQRWDQNFCSVGLRLVKYNLQLVARLHEIDTIYAVTNKFIF